MEKKTEGKITKASNVVLALCILAIIVALTVKVIQWILSF